MTPLKQQISTDTSFNKKDNNTIAAIDISASDGGGENTWSTFSKTGNKTAKINVARAQNDTSKTANINWYQFQ